MIHFSIIISTYMTIQERKRRAKVQFSHFGRPYARSASNIKDHDVSSSFSSSSSSSSRKERRRRRRRYGKRIASRRSWGLRPTTRNSLFKPTSLFGIEDAARGLLLLLDPPSFGPSKNIPRTKKKERKKERTKLNDLFRDTDIRERKRESLHKDRRRPPPGQTDRQVVVGPVARCAFAYYINLAKLVVVGSNAMCNAMQCASEWSSSSRNRQWPHPRESLGRGLKREAGRRLFINRAKSLSPGHYCLASLLILLLLLLYVWGVLWCSALHLPPWERRRRRRRTTPKLDPLERVSLF